MIKETKPIKKAVESPYDITTVLDVKENNNLRLMVHREGSGNLSIHDVVKVKMSTMHLETTHKFKCRTISLKLKNGTSFDINIFTNDKV